MSDDLSATLAAIRERAEGPMRKFGDVDASQRDVPLLLAALEAVLKLADGWKQFAASGDAQDECADELRAAITAALLGKGADHG